MDGDCVNTEGDAQSGMVMKDAEQWGVINWDDTSWSIYQTLRSIGSDGIQKYTEM